MIHIFCRTPLEYQFIKIVCNNFRVQLNTLILELLKWCIFGVLLLYARGNTNSKQAELGGLHCSPDSASQRAPCLSRGKLSRSVQLNGCCWVLLLVVAD